MHTNILNKVLAALTGLLLCTESAVAQVQGENGYWKFRDATVFGVSNSTEEGTGSRSNKEVHQYDKGHFTVTQQYTEGGQTFTAEATGVVQGLSKQVKPGDEMPLSISLSAPGGSGPRGNKIWGEAHDRFTNPKGETFKAEEILIAVNERLPQAFEQLKAEQKAEAPTTGGDRFCQNCGKPLVEGDSFCRNCGKKIE